MFFFRWKNVFRAFLVFILFSWTASQIYFDFKNPWLLEGQSTLKAINKALTYLQQQPESVTNDVVFGVLIARANLQWINSRLKSHSDYIFTGALAKMINKCDNIVVNFNGSQTRSLLNLSFWDDRAGDLKSGVLQQNEHFVLPKFTSCRSINAYMMRGTPEDSDLCIHELFNSKCKISNFCWFSEMKGNFHSGYKTSHRLIYLQTAEKLQCGTANPQKFSSINGNKKKLCGQMLSEAKALHQHPFFPLTLDLFMEQIALCGLEGHEEFARKTWRDEVRTWQNSNGCFGQGMNFNDCPMDSKKRVKRSDSIITNCHTHMTAVAISAMAFHLRFILKKIFLK